MVSKTKIGAALIGVAALIGTVGGYLSGTIELGSAIQAIMVEAGAVLAAFGIRDLPVLNKTK
jgi:hypothetical protein